MLLGGVVLLHLKFTLFQAFSEIKGIFFCVQMLIHLFFLSFLYLQSNFKMLTMVHGQV